jgi:hypothetical protein
MPAAGAAELKAHRTQAVRGDRLGVVRLACGLIFRLRGTLRTPGGAPRQAFIALCDFEHGAPGDGIEYLNGKLAGIFGTIVPMPRVLKQLLCHLRSLPFDASPTPLSRLTGVGFVFMASV